MVSLVVEHVIPAAFRLLPAALRSSEAAALVTAIGLQESRFLARHQRPEGPAHGFWQFERAGLRAVLSHPHTKAFAADAILELRYQNIAFATLHGALEHNDLLACVCARLLLWPDPDPLPGPEAPDAAWTIYLRTWQPGRPIKDTWPSLYKEAWDRISLAVNSRSNGKGRKDISDAARFDRREAGIVSATG